MTFRSLLNQPVAVSPVIDLSADLVFISAPAVQENSVASSAGEAGHDAAGNDGPSMACPPNPLPTKRGRRRDPAWDEVIVADDIISCKKCERIIHLLGRTHVERVRHHLEKKCTKRAKTKSIAACFPVALGTTKITAFKKHFAIWFYSTGMAFHKVSHPSLLQALQILHPEAAIPSEHQLSTSLLDMFYNDFKVLMTYKLRGRKCTLNTDGWTDINGNSVINYVLVSDGEAYYLESVYTGSISHDAVFLASDVKRVLESVKFTTIVAVVTDNTAANQLMRSTLQDAYPNIFFHGCIAHVIHLIVKDMVSKLKWLGKLEADCRKMVKFFKKHQLLWAELRRLQRLEGKNALVLPADTRWGTFEKCFKSVLDSESILLTMISGREFLKARSKEQKAKRRMAFNVVMSHNFVPQLKKAVALLSVLSKAQKVFERGEHPISDVYRMFIQLPQQYTAMKMPIGELGVISGILKDRFDFVYGDAHGVSYLLDPRYGGEGMDEDTKNSVVDFIANWQGPEHEEAAAVELMRYQAFLLKNTRELKLVKDKRVSVQEFWSGLREFPLLRKIATSLFASACSSAAAERNFSTHKFIHSAVRNRLKEGSVEKLVYIFFNAKNMDLGEIAAFNDYEDLAEVSSDEEPNNQNSDFEYY